MPSAPAPPERRARWRDSHAGLPRGIWALGFVSLLMDISSEMIHALLPIYLMASFGASTLMVGVIEGIAEATAAIIKVFSGALSDKLGKRKLLAVLGYGLAAVTKPVFPLAPAVSWLVAARFLDRLGKGIRGAPRDALVADIAPAHLCGAAFGLRQSLDTVGAFAGPLLAIGLLVLFHEQITPVFWFATIPAVLAVIVLIVFVREPEHRAPPLRAPLSRAELGRLGGAYWLVVGVAALFTLARFSEAFLVLKAQAVGLPLTLIPTVMVVMSLVYALAAYPAGVISDRAGRWPLLIVGLGALIVADLVLAFATGQWLVLVGVGLWGLHMGLTQGLLTALVADAAPAELRGTAFGVFNLAIGVALLVASALAGALWDAAGPQATFLAGALFTALALLGMLALRHRGATPG